MAVSRELKTLIHSRDASFELGANSHTRPSRLPQAQYAWAENCVNEDSSIATRWGFENLLKFNCGRAQGCALFRPSGISIPILYMAISGEIWFSRYPYTSAERLPNITFRPDLDMVTFKEATVANTPTGAVSPYQVLIMQDGITAPAYTDGLISRHLDPTPDGFFNPFSIGAKETRVGLAMEYVGGRLWVQNGREIFASDIYDPLHFIETTYLAGGGSFLTWDGAPVNSLMKTADGRQLLAGTNNNTTAFDASNTTRSSWANDPNFVRLLFPGVGWVGPKCGAELNGELFWMSKEGMRFYNAVGQTSFSARRGIMSQEMKESFEKRSPLIRRSCAGAFEAYGLSGFPSGDQYNRHIWAINTSDNDLLAGAEPYSWLPIWKGIRPVEFCTAEINGENRMFCLEQGRDIPRVWELFKENRRDYYQMNGTLNEQPIQCRLRTRGHDFKELFSFKTFQFSHIHIEKLFGSATFNASVRSEFSCFRDYGSFNLCTTDCVELDPDACLFKTPPEKQSRYLKTQEIKGACNEGGSPVMTNSGTYFQFQYDWTGELAIRGMDHYGIQIPEIIRGACKSGDESCVNLSCCNEELDYWSSPEEFFASYYYDGECHVMEVTDE